MTESDIRADKLRGVLLGTAIGDSLGLPFENMKPGLIKRIFKNPDRFYFFGNNGLISDDTVLSALVASSLTQKESEKILKSFRRGLLFWFFSLPWGIGLGTLQSCLKILVGIKKSGARRGSAGNGVAMRSSIIGVLYEQDKMQRLDIAKSLAEITHQDDRAIEAGLYLVELSAQLVSRKDSNATDLAFESLNVVDNKELLENIKSAIELARKGADYATAANSLGTTGYAVHTAAFSTFCFLRGIDTPMLSLFKCIRMGGDTDTNAAIVGALFGAKYGTNWIPEKLISRLQSGPFGNAHVNLIVDDIINGKVNNIGIVTWFSYMLRNLLTFPLVLILVIINLVRSVLRV